MVEHLTQQQFEDYCRQQLSVAELLLVSDHLGECEACRRRVEGAMNGGAAFFALRSELFGEAAEAASAAHPVRAHLTAEQTAAYVDGAPSGETLRTVAAHLATCEQCDLAVEDLRAFRDEVLPSLESEYRQEPGEKAVTTRQVERSSQLEGLTRPPSSLMGSGKQRREFSVMEPVGNVLLTAQPTFRWSPMEGATGSVAEVYDGKFNPVATSPKPARSNRRRAFAFSFLRPSKIFRGAQ